MPCQFLYALVIVVFHKLFVFILIVQTHDTLQQCIREFQFSNFFHQHFAYVQQELIIAVGHKLIGNHFFHFSAEFFFALNHILAEYLIENFLIQFAFHETGDFFYLETEI